LAQLPERHLKMTIRVCDAVNTSRRNSTWEFRLGALGFADHIRLMMMMTPPAFYVL
jgi:hypothetical protein